MKIQAITSQHQKIQNFLSEADSFDADQIELQAHWAKYICVLSSGFLENAIKEVYSKYARSCSNKSVSDYVESNLSRIQNPKSLRFLEVASSFNKEWRKDLEKYMEEDGRSDAIDSIMANRHLIAHGKDSRISLVRVRKYLSKSVKVIEFIEEQCGV